MSYTRQQWATALLNQIGNKSPSASTVNWLVGWTNYETAAGHTAAYNLLNTTLGEPGATDYNSVGVKNYTSFAQGIQANAQTLQGGYPQLLADLKSNNVTDLASNSLITQEIAKWGTGKTGAQIQSAGGHGASDTFDGTGPSSNPLSGIVSSVGNAISGVISGLFGIQIQGANSAGATGIQVGSLPPLSLAPNATVTQALVTIDAALALVNPFIVQGAQTDTLGVLGTGVSFTDPISWVEGFGINVVEDIGALIWRALLIGAGIVLLYMAASTFVDFGKVAQDAAGLAAKAGPLLLA